MPYKKEQYAPPAEIAAKAIASRDGLAIEEMLKHIAFSPAPKEDRSEALQRVALHHNEMTHIVIGVLSTLSNIDPPAARRLAHASLSEKSDRERDHVYAAAARVLVEMVAQNEQDIPVIARCLRSPFDSVRGATLRALQNLQPFVAAIVLEKAEPLQQTPGLTQLVHALKEITLLRRTSLPPLPAEKEDEHEDTAATVNKPPIPRAPKIKRPSRPPRVPKAPPIERREPEQPVMESRKEVTETPELQPNKRVHSPTLTSEQRCLLLPLSSSEAQDLSSNDLAIAISREKAPEKLLGLLCELALRDGRSVLLTHMSELVWLTSTKFGEGNRDVRTLTEILFAE